MEVDVPDLCYERPIYYEVVEGKPFTFTTESTLIRIRIELVLIFLKSGGQLWAPDDYWTQVGVLTEHSAATADFNWSPSQISVSVSCFGVIFRWRKITNDSGNGGWSKKVKHSQSLTQFFGVVFAVREKQVYRLLFFWLCCFKRFLIICLWSWWVILQTLLVKKCVFPWV